MSYTVYMLDDAERDLRDIHSYIKHHFSEKLANELYIEIKTKILRNSKDTHFKKQQPSNKSELELAFVFFRFREAYRRVGLLALLTRRIC